MKRFLVGRTALACCVRYITPPPPLPPKQAGSKGLPPPPPLPGRSGGGTQGAGMAGSQPSPQAPSTAGWKSPPEILAMFIDYIPTFFVPVTAVHATLPDEHRQFVKKHKLHQFLKKYRFYFDIRQVDGARYDVRVRGDVTHPRKGSADNKYELSDIGAVATFTVKPECVELSDFAIPEHSVPLKPQGPPPSVQVRLEERVPVLERLKNIIPEDFEAIESVEERVPEDILFHPYFDCQGGLVAIASKFPDVFQVVGPSIRRKPSHIAPLALDEFSFDNSPEPVIIAKVREKVCISEVPQWVSVTSLYEILTLEERRLIKKRFKSFASFLRAHGRSLAVSSDTLSVSFWSKKKKKVASVEGEEQQAQQPAPPSVAQFTHLHIVNELFEKLPANRPLNLRDAVKLLPREMINSLPRNVVGWLANYPAYFSLDGMTETDLSRVYVHRAASSTPLDLALALYKHIPDEGIACSVLEEILEPSVQDVVKRLGLSNLIISLKDWLEVLDGDIFKKRALEELEDVIKQEAVSRRAERRGAIGDGVDEGQDS